MTSFNEVVGTNDESWMTNPHRNCAIPDDRAAIDVRILADQWFPSSRYETSEAKRLCEGCPVRTPCLAYALERPWIEGIWGATSQSGRAILRAKQRGDAA